MDQTTMLLTIFGMAAVTYLPRLLPLWLFTSKPLPRLMITWLRYVPVAILAAMLFPALLVTDRGIELGVHNVYLWASVPTLIVAWRTRSLFGSVMVGMAIVALVRWI
jgi:branched-subunit amino acid transport protein